MSNSESIKCELTVVGTGIAGMASALFAANRGLSTVLVGSTGEVLFASGSEYNVGGYSSQEVDSLLQMASREQDREASFELYRQAEQILVDDAACLPLWNGQSYVLVKPYVAGYKLNPLGYADLSEVSIELD